MEKHKTGRWLTVHDASGYPAAYKRGDGPVWSALMGASTGPRHL